MKGVSHSRICTSVLWTLFFSFLLVHGDDFMEQGMCLIKLVCTLLPRSILTSVFPLEF